MNQNKKLYLVILFNFCLPQLVSSVHARDYNEDGSQNGRKHIALKESAHTGGNIFGGIQTSEKNISGYHLTITGDADIAALSPGEKIVLINSVQGGSGTTGDVRENTVTTGNSNIKYLKGGSSVSGKAAGNSVITKGGIVGTMAGGESVSGEVTGNRIILHSTSSTVNAYGGTSVSGDARDNRAEVNGGTVTQLSGGDSGTGNAAGNNVTVRGNALVFMLHGGRSQKGGASGNTVTIAHGRSGSVYGGYTISGPATGNTVIARNLSTTNLFGGYSKENDATNNHVVLYDGVVPVLAGGFSAGGNVTGNRLDLYGGTLKNVVGSLTTDGHATGTTVTVFKAPYFEKNAYIYGGFSDNARADVFSGNTLNTHAGGMSLLHVSNFERYIFFTPRASDGRTPVFTLQHGPDLSRSSIRMRFESDRTAVPAGRVYALFSKNPLSKEPDFTIPDGMPLTGFQGISLEHALVPVPDGGGISAGIRSTSVREQVKSLYSGQAAATMLIRGGAALITDQALRESRMAALVLRNQPAAAQRAHMRHERDTKRTDPAPGGLRTDSSPAGEEPETIPAVRMHPEKRDPAALAEMVRRTRDSAVLAELALYKADAVARNDREALRELKMAALMLRERPEDPATDSTAQDSPAREDTGTAAQAFPHEPRMTGQAAPPRQDSFVLFSPVTAGGSQYNFGHSFDFSSCNALLGAGKIFSTESAAFFSGLFLETGKGRYRAQNKASGALFRSSGHTSYYGGGVLAQLTFTSGPLSGLYFEGSARGGLLNIDHDSPDLLNVFSGDAAAYSMQTGYYGLHCGLGFLLPLHQDLILDLHGAYLHSRQFGGEMTIAGDPFDFPGGSSGVLYGGGFLTYTLTPLLTPYLSLGYEYESRGRFTASAYSLPGPESSLRGGTALAGLGLRIRSGNTLSLDLGIQGSSGQRRGISGSAQLRYEF